MSSNLEFVVSGVGCFLVFACLLVALAITAHAALAAHERERHTSTALHNLQKELIKRGMAELVKLSNNKEELILIVRRTPNFPGKKREG